MAVLPYDRGWSSQCGCELCGDPLELASGGGYRACDSCRAEHRIGDVYRSSMAMVVVGGARGAVASISRLLAPWGISVKRNTITRWGKRGRIQPVGVDTDGVTSVYLVWDVWQAYANHGAGRP